MRRGFLFLGSFAVAVVIACSGNSPPPIDAKSIDSPSGSGLGFGSDCTTVSDTSTECASGVCTNSFNQLPTPVCSQKCTTLGGTDSTCPVGSMGQKCNQMGYCRP